MSTLRPAPIGLRLPDDTLKEVDGWAEDNCYTRHGALVALIEKGLGHEPGPPGKVERPTRRPTPQGLVSQIAGVQLGSSLPKPGSLLKQPKKAK